MAKSASAGKIQQESIGKRDREATASIDDLLGIDSSSESSSEEFNAECKFFAGVHTDENNTQKSNVGLPKSGSRAAELPN